jgi:hypothetical protein
VESALDAEPIEILGIPMDNLRDELGLGEQGEEIPQSEIGISIADYQESTEPVHDSSILASTLPPNEKQLEAKNLRHI